MATYDDYDGVYFTIQSLKMYHPLVNRDDVEIIVVDNNPDSPHGEATKNLVTKWVKNAKYIPYTLRKTTAVRNEIFKHAEGKYTISMDPHVLFMPNALESLIQYYAMNPYCKDIVQGPMLYDDLKSAATHFKPTWGGDMYGQWGINKEALLANKPFPIQMHGLGVFSCETTNWRGFNKHFKGFGGEEGYIHEKFRMLGGKSMCLPNFRWLHRFGRPGGVPYPLSLEDRVWNYFIGWLELKQDENHPMIKEIYDNFKDRIPKNVLDEILEKTKQKMLN